MQSLSIHLSALIAEKKFFKIKFKQYDKGTHIFYPNYYAIHAIQVGDIIAWFWGDSLKMGIAKEILSKNVVVISILTRKKMKSEVELMVHLKSIECIFQQE